MMTPMIILHLIQIMNQQNLMRSSTCVKSATQRRRRVCCFIVLVVLDMSTLIV
uniref:Uncharacterized protein n=1 Tax=Arundo donax TaxID=35708 RepID=A0A0A9CN05_ARUDO